MASLAGSVVSKAISIVSSIPKAAKKLLHIGSPSKVFYEIGTQIIDGLTLGLDDNADAPAASVENVVNSIIDSVNTIPSLSDLMEVSPTITPVVDLTQVQAAADQMNSIFATSPVATASFGQAASISSTQAAQGAVSDTTGAEASVIKFEQNNYSPESLSPVEIYRQTKNQLSQMRTALANA
jgi:hypothetical protein